MTTAAVMPNIGVVHGMMPIDYHATRACSKSLLDKLALSPAHCLDAINNPDSSTTPAKTLGSAVHCAVLEPTQFHLRYAVRAEGVHGNSSEGKAFKASAEAAGKTMLTCDEGRWCEAIASSVRRNKEAMRLINNDNASIESSLFWQREGYPCKCRPDVLSPEAIVDLKTTISANPIHWPREVARYRYHLQAAWYLDGAARLLEYAPERFIFIAVEKRRPFVVQLYEIRIGCEAWRTAMDECDRLFAVYAQCWKNRHWPGYSESILELTLPEWASEPASESELIEF